MQQKQRQKHFNRQIPAAACLIQVLYIWPQYARRETLPTAPVLIIESNPFMLPRRPANMCAFPRPSRHRGDALQWRTWIQPHSRCFWERDPTSPPPLCPPPSPRNRSVISFFHTRLSLCFRFLPIMWAEVRSRCGMKQQRCNAAIPACSRGQFYWFKPSRFEASQRNLLVSRRGVFNLLF